MSDSALRFDRVTKNYGAVRALDDVSFAVPRGAMFGLIGPDGAGKTTAIRLTGGLLTPDGGRIDVLGRDPKKDHRALTGAIGYLSQRFSLYGDLSIDENVAFFALAPFRRRRADRLSGGMKQKLALACTLVHEPELLLLDEPTTGVDPVSRREFWKLLAEFLARGLTIVMATPYLDEAERCSRVALLHDGRLMALDEPPRLQAALAGQLLEVIVDAPRPPIDVLARVDGVADVQSFGDRAHVRLAGIDQRRGAERIGEALAHAGVKPVGVRPIAASL
ncbi:MAG: multidrug ABC transporter ATP-binding protein, partial [Acidobacteria bacterium]